MSTNAHPDYSDTALMHTCTMISAYDEDLKLVYCNAAARASIPENVVCGKDRLVERTDLSKITCLMTNSSHCDIEAKVNTVSGVRWHALHVERGVDPVSSRSLYVLTETDITEKRTEQEEVYRLAHTDSLTALPNRTALHNYLDKKLNSKVITPFGMLFLDLDRFKIINDSLGHKAGDQLLICVAVRLQQALGSDGLVYRIGGDEFVALTTSKAKPESLTTIARQFLQAMATPITISGHKIRTQPSIGICTYPVGGTQAVTLLENADKAMYIAKARQCGYCFYENMMTKSIAENVKDRMDLENDMTAALNNSEFELYFQPKIRCSDLSVSGVEALIRWHHPTRGMVPPDKFISIAEDTGQIIEIGKWVLIAAMRQQRGWHEQGIDVPVSVNISPRQFRFNDLLADVENALANTHCPTDMIELEITESLLIGDPDAVNETLIKLSSLGIRLALDDFGTGFANLDSLQKYPLDSLKIDKIFLSDRKRSMLLSTILKMGKVLGLEVVAEGVETNSQIDWLGANGCDVMQGFFFCKPKPADQITQYLIDNAATPGDISDAA